MLGKTVKKWLGQRKDIFSVCKLLSSTPNFKDLTPEKCLKEYSKYIKYYNIKSHTSENIDKLLSSGKNVHIYGESGSGKSFLVERLCDILGLNLIKSYARSEEDLLEDFGNFPFEENTNSVFLLEGDSYYWKKYGLVKKYVEDSKAPFIIITIGRNTPTKWITKLINQVKVYPPSETEVLRFLQFVYPNFNPLDLKIVYSRDWRTVWMNLKYKLNTKQEDKIFTQEYDAKTLAFKIVMGNADYSDFDKCKHPISWVLNWIGYNASNFWSGVDLRKNLSTVSWCDSNKYNTNEEFIKRTLLTLIPSTIKGEMFFPPFRKEETNEKKEDSYIIRSYKAEKTFPKKQVKKNEEYKGLEDEIGDMMLI